MNADKNKNSLIQFPCAFPIKVMGLNTEDLVPTLTALALRFDPTFEASDVALRHSKGGKYLGVTLTIEATSRLQLDALYRALSSHPMVRVVL